MNGGGFFFFLMRCLVDASLYYGLCCDDGCSLGEAHVHIVYGGL